MTALAETLRGPDVTAWLDAPSPVHLKLYSIPFALLGPLLGVNVLSAEPLNLLYYLAVLVLVYLMGAELYGRRAGLCAAGAVALWPSFLLHTTQLLKDPLFITALLALVLVGLRLLTREYSWRRGLAAGVAGGAALVVLWLVRRDMWEVMLAFVLVASGLFVVRQLRERRVLGGNLIAAALLLVLALCVPHVVRPPQRATTTEPASGVAAEPSAADAARLRERERRRQLQRGAPAGASLAERISLLRHRFKELYPGAGSNLDAEVRFEGTADVVRYVPRAALIGFFAPFPEMWLARGEQVGRAGRLLSGAETLAMYLLTLAAVVGWWRGPRRLAASLLMLTAAAGATALGLVVTNIGALYRMRYAFWMLLIVVGSQEVARVLSRRRGRPASPAAEAAGAGR